MFNPRALHCQLGNARRDDSDGLHRIEVLRLQHFNVITRCRRLEQRYLKHRTISNTHKGKRMKGKRMNGKLKGKEEGRGLGGKCKHTSLF